MPCWCWGDHFRWGESRDSFYRRGWIGGSRGQNYSPAFGRCGCACQGDEEGNRQGCSDDKRILSCLCEDGGKVHADRSFQPLYRLMAEAFRGLRILEDWGRSTSRDTHAYLVFLEAVLLAGS